MNKCRAPFLITLLALAPIGCAMAQSKGNQRPEKTDPPQVVVAPNKEKSPQGGDTKPKEDKKGKP